jgi:hypothetical protein
MPIVWAEDVAVYAQGFKLAARPRAKGGVGNFVVGLLKIEPPNQTPVYALGIGFEHRLLSFDSPELTALEQNSGDFKLDVYTERTRLVSPAQFVGVDTAYAFNLLTPESQLPPASHGKIRSVVVVQPTKPLAAADALDLLSHTISSFSFNAVVNPASAPLPTQKESAQQLAAENLLAAEAAPILIAQNPQVVSIVSSEPPTGDGDHFQSIDQFVTFMTFHFTRSMLTPAHAAWMLAASGISAETAYAVLGKYRLSLRPQDLLENTLGAFPGPVLREAITRLQTEGTSAPDAATQLKLLNPAFDRDPVQLGILLRINFYDIANTPLAIAQAWKNAGYPSTNYLPDKLGELFPLTDRAELTSALRQAYGA